MESNHMQKIKAISKWTIRKYMPISIAYWILLFLSFPVLQLFLLWLITAAPDEGRVGYINTMKSVPETLIPFILVAVAMSTVISFITFSYMHNKRCVDFFGSLPVSRRTMFFTRYCSVLGMLLIPILLWGIIGSSLTLSGEGFVTDMKVVISLLLAVWGNTTFIAFISLCSGTVADMVISYLALNVAYPICVTILGLFPAMILPGMEMISWDASVFTFFSPLGAAFTGAYGECLILHCIWWVVISAIVLVGCTVLCKKRKAETAQNSFTFSVLSNTIKFIVCFGGGFGLGWVLSYIAAVNNSMLSGYVWFYIGLVIGVMVANILLHLIFYKGLTNYLSSLKLCGGVIVIASLFLFSVTTGGLGYDTYIPDAEDVQEVGAVYVGDEFYVGNKNIMQDYYSKPEDIQSILKFHQKVVDAKGRYKKNGMYPLSGYWYDNNGYEGDAFDYVSGDIRITYFLKNGKKVTRYYEVRVQDHIVLDKYTNVLNAAGIRRERISEIPERYLEDRTLYIDSVGYAELSNEIDMTKEQSERLLNALRSDYKKNGAIDGVKYEDESAVFNENRWYNSVAYRLQLDYNDKQDHYLNVEWVVDETYVETMKVLKEMNALNFYYIEMKKNARNIKDIDIASAPKRTVYFSRPESWGEGKVHGNLIDSKTKLPLCHLGKFDLSCENVSGRILKCEIPMVEGYDQIIFYQKDAEAYEMDYDRYWLSGGIKLPDDAKLNHLILEEDDSVNSSEVRYPDSCYQYQWKTFENKENN